MVKNITRFFLAVILPYQIFTQFQSNLDIINRFVVVNLSQYTSNYPYIKMNNSKYFIFNSYYIKKWKAQMQTANMNNKFQLYNRNNLMAQNNYSYWQITSFNFKENIYSIIETRKSNFIKKITRDNFELIINIKESTFVEEHPSMFNLSHFTYKNNKINKKYLSDFCQQILKQKVGFFKHCIFVVSKQKTFTYNNFSITSNYQKVLKSRSLNRRIQQNYHQMNQNVHKFTNKLDKIINQENQILELNLQELSNTFFGLLSTNEIKSIDQYLKSFKILYQKISQKQLKKQKQRFINLYFKIISCIMLFFLVARLLINNHKKHPFFRKEIGIV